MIRTFRSQALTGAAQPWFGDKITAAFVPPGAGGRCIVQVADSTIYQGGDRIILGAGQAGANILLVTQIPDATHLYCKSEGDAPVSAWAINTLIALDIACYAISFIQFPGAAATTYLGTDNSVTAAGGGNVFYALSGGGSFMYSKQEGQNPLRTAEGWMAGAATDSMIVAAYVN